LIHNESAPLCLCKAPGCWSSGSTLTNLAVLVSYAPDGLPVSRNQIINHYQVTIIITIKWLSSKTAIIQNSHHPRQTTSKTVIIRKYKIKKTAIAQITCH
ncbi:MAG: hypothetical protein RIR52_2706, partial [Acidobacteriota bacterium]|jgi:hypothetical protein